MTSGNIPLGPDPDQILEALQRAVRNDPEIRERSAEEVSKELVRGGYLDEEPDPVLVAEMVEGLEAEEQSLQPDELSEEGNPHPGDAEPERLRRALARLMDAQQEALETSNRALEGLDEDARQEESARLESALVDVRDILEGASEDVLEILAQDGAPPEPEGEA